MWGVSAHRTVRPQSGHDRLGRQSDNHVQNQLYSPTPTCASHPVCCLEDEPHLKVKLFETFISGAYMEYGKACYIKGKKIRFGIKRATRIGTESQENIPFINTKVSGICSTGVVSASDSLTSAASYVTTCIEVLYTVKKRAPPGVDIPVERMVVLLLLNR